MLARIPADDRPLVERSLQLLLTALQTVFAGSAPCPVPGEFSAIRTESSKSGLYGIDLPSGARLVSGFVRATKPSAAMNAADPSIHQVSPPDGGGQEPSSRRSKTIWPITRSRLKSCQ